VKMFAEGTYEGLGRMLLAAGVKEDRIEELVVRVIKADAVETRAALRRDQSDTLVGTGRPRGISRLPDPCPFSAAAHGGGHRSRASDHVVSCPRLRPPLGGATQPGRPLWHRIACFRPVGSIRVRKADA